MFIMYYEVMPYSLHYMFYCTLASLGARLLNIMETPFIYDGGNIRGGLKVAADRKALTLLRMVFFIYLILVVKVIIFKYPNERLEIIVSDWSREVIREGMNSANFTPFKTIKMYIRYADRLNSFENLIGNIVVFVPFGLLLPAILPRGRRFPVFFFHVFIFVFGLEAFQLFSAFGAFDVDDILLNSLGAVLGWMLYRRRFRLHPGARSVSTR